MYVVQISLRPITLLHPLLRHINCYILKFQNPFLLTVQGATSLSLDNYVKI